MDYRILGNTGLKVSEIALGCEGFEVENGVLIKEFVDTAEKYGVNFIDLYNANPNTRKLLGEALENRQEKFILQAHLCTVWENNQYKRTRKIDDVTASFKDLLIKLKTDYIDIGMIHYVDSLKDWEVILNGSVMELALKLKSQGKIRHIGLSSHNPVVAKAAIDSGLIEVLMFSINPCYDLQPADENIEKLWIEDSYKAPLINMDPNREALYDSCQRNGIGITVMKAFGGGDLLDAALSPAKKELTVYECLHYALTRPAVATVLAGAKTMDEFTHSISYSTASESERDFSKALASFPKISWEGHCMYCGHCAPCPVGIDVAALTKLLNLGKIQDELPETVREHYFSLEHIASECTACGACEKRCPFNVLVIENMKTAEKIFGK